MQELASFANPPKAIVILIQAIGIFLQPDISSDKYTWDDGRKLLRNKNFLGTLLAFDKERITAEQVTRVTSYITRDEMQPAVMAKISRAGVGLLQWFRAMHQIGQIKHQMASN